MALARGGAREALRPPLKWAGGKRWLLPVLAPLWAPFRRRRLVEPFCGGLAVSLGLRPKRALVSDVNPHPVNFYRCLQRGLRTRIALRNDADLFYAHRSEFNRLVTEGKQFTRKAAELFYYLNRTGYNGLCRFNRRGEFNVPFGRYHRINYVRDFTPYRPALEPWEIVHSDFADLALRPGDFVYADPPYHTTFHQYSKDGFEWSEQVRLAEWLAAHPGPVVLSNQATPPIVRLYRRLGYDLRFLAAPRSISSSGDRTPAREVLATRNLATGAPGPPTGVN